MKQIVGVFTASCIYLALLSGLQAELRTVTYEGQEKCMELSNGVARLVIAPSSGGRIVHYSRDGGPNFFRGGCQIDIGPELEYPPKHQPLWSGAYAVQTLGPLSVRLTSPEDEATGVQLAKVIKLAPKSSPSPARVTLQVTMKNISDEEIAYCLWDRTMTRATYGFFQLNPDSRFPAKWSLRRGEHGTYAYDGKTPSSPRVEIVGNLLVTVPGKKMEKIAADSMAGWIGGFHDGWLYLKRFPVYPNGDYADGGNSVEIWVDAAGERTEIEPLSPKVQLQPGDTYAFVETWELRRVDQEINAPRDIPALLEQEREGGSPFSRQRERGG